MNSKSIWVGGLIIILISGLINGIFIRQNIGGLFRELMRFGILIGLAIFAWGLIQTFRSKS